MKKLFRILAVVLIFCLSLGNATAETTKTNKNKPISITFKDKNLEKAVRAKIKKPKGIIYTTDVNKIKDLDLINIGITDITPLKYFTNLSKLQLQNIEQPNPNYIKDISSLKYLKNLTYLDLTCNDISSTSPLNGLTNLTNLYLGYTHTIKNISFIKAFKKLKSLGLTEMDLTDISVLKSCNNLEDLHLWGNNIIDLTPLKGLTKLKKLELSNNEISDLSPIKGLKSIKYLGLMNNNIENISILRNMDKLEHLYLRGNEISDFSCTSSYYQNLKENDFAPYVYLTGLKLINSFSTEGCAFECWPVQYNCIVFHMNDGMDHGENNLQSLEYDINNKYNFFVGVFSKYNITSHDACIKIFGDNTLLYTSPFIKVEDDTVPFKINISGISKLKIQIESPGMASHDDYEYILGSPCLY